MAEQKFPIVQSERTVRYFAMAEYCGFGPLPWGVCNYLREDGVVVRSTIHAQKEWFNSDPLNRGLIWDREHNFVPEFKVKPPPPLPVNHIYHPENSFAFLKRILRTTVPGGVPR